MCQTISFVWETAIMAAWQVTTTLPISNKQKNVELMGHHHELAATTLLGHVCMRAYRCRVGITMEMIGKNKTALKLVTKQIKYAKKFIELKL